MKGILKKFGFAGIIVLAGAGTALAATDTSGLCGLIVQMQGVFKILRTLAFVGAAFFIAQWAWGYISKGDVEMKDLQAKGTGLLVGFVLLFGIGFVLQFLMSSAGMNVLGCEQVLISGWN